MISRIIGVLILCLALNVLLVNVASLAQGSKKMTAKRALIVVTSHGQMGDTGKPTGYYLAEVAHPYTVLKDKGFELNIASPKGGKAPMDPNSFKLTDAVNKAFMENKASKEQLENTLKLETVKAEDYDAILFAGGHGTMWDFPDNADIQRLGKQIYEKGGVVAAVCHGPAALVNMKLSNGKYLVEGKKVATFTNEEETEKKLEKVMPFLLETKLKERGATVEKAPNWKAKVVTNERLVTGQNPASAEGVGEAVAKILSGKVAISL